MCVCEEYHSTTYKVVFFLPLTLWRGNGSQYFFIFRQKVYYKRTLTSIQTSIQPRRQKHEQPPQKAHTKANTHSQTHVCTTNASVSPGMRAPSQHGCTTQSPLMLYRNIFVHTTSVSHAQLHHIPSM